MAQFLVGDDQWLSTLRVLRRGRLVDLRLPRSGGPRVVVRESCGLTSARR